MKNVSIQQMGSLCHCQRIRFVPLPVAMVIRVRLIFVGLVVVKVEVTQVICQLYINIFQVHLIVVERWHMLIIAQ